MCCRLPNNISSSPKKVLAFQVVWSWIIFSWTSFILSEIKHKYLSSKSNWFVWIAYEITNRAKFFPGLFSLFSDFISIKVLSIIDFNSRFLKIPLVYHSNNLIVKPGVTGLAHLKSTDISINSVRNFENYYAMHYSFIFDIEILLKSIFRI